MLIPFFPLLSSSLRRRPARFLGTLWWIIYYSSEFVISFSYNFYGFTHFVLNKYVCFLLSALSLSAVSVNLIKWLIWKWSIKNLKLSAIRIYLCVRLEFHKYCWLTCPCAQHDNSSREEERGTKKNIRYRGAFRFNEARARAKQQSVFGGNGLSCVFLVFVVSVVSPRLFFWTMSPQLCLITRRIGVGCGRDIWTCILTHSSSLAASHLGPLGWARFFIAAKFWIFLVSRSECRIDFPWIYPLRLHCFRRLNATCRAHVDSLFFTSERFLRLISAWPFRKIRVFLRFLVNILFIYS